MGRAGAEAGNVKAELYELTHRGNAGDAAFYARVCRGARSVLELGSGSGRLLRELAEPGRRLVGLERDPDTLALAKRNLSKVPAPLRKSVELVAADMRDFELPGRFERALLPYNALYCLLNQRDALACFRSVRRALELGGLFVLDVWNAESFHRAPAMPARGEAEPLVSLEHARRTWDVFEESSFVRSRQRVDVTYSYVPRSGGSVLSIPIAQRYYLAPEIEHLLGRARFEVESVYGDFSRKRFGARSPHLIVLGRAV
jgi:SAM-dependent methyltransferase